MAKSKCLNFSFVRKISKNKKFQGISAVVRLPEIALFSGFYSSVWHSLFCDGKTDCGKFSLPKIILEHHSSEIRGVGLMKCFREMLQNLKYFWNTNKPNLYKNFQFVLLYFSPNEKK